MKITIKLGDKDHISFARGVLKKLAECVFNEWDEIEIKANNGHLIESYCYLKPKQEEGFVILPDFYAKNTGVGPTTR